MESKTRVSEVMCKTNISDVGTIDIVHPKPVLPAFCGPKNIHRKRLAKTWFAHFTDLPLTQQTSVLPLLLSLINGCTDSENVGMSAPPTSIQHNTSALHPLMFTEWRIPETSSPEKLPHQN